MTAKSSTERSREFRRRIALRGQASMTLTVDDATSTLLRDLAQQHDQSIGAIVRPARSWCAASCRRAAGRPLLHLQPPAQHAQHRFVRCAMERGTSMQRLDLQRLPDRPAARARAAGRNATAPSS